MITKIGCVIVGTHSLDTIQASFRQVWTGRQVSTDTYNSVVFWPKVWVPITKLP